MTFFIFLALLMLVPVFMLIRNERVYSRRMALLARIHELALQGTGDDWSDRYKRFHAISYNQMMKQFWRPVDSFFKGEDFYVPSTSWTAPATALPDTSTATATGSQAEKGGSL